MAIHYNINCHGKEETYNTVRQRASGIGGRIQEMIRPQISCALSCYPSKEREPFQCGGIAETGCSRAVSFQLDEEICGRRDIRIEDKTGTRAICIIESDLAQIKIPEVNVNLRNKYTVKFNPHPDDNIIVCINGSGKTSLLSEIEKIIPKGNHIYIQSIDNLMTCYRRKKEAAFSQDLDSYNYNMKTGPSMMYYRMSMLDSSADKQTKVIERLAEFFYVINSLFKGTGKHIGLEGNKFIINANGTLLSLNDLSSGENKFFHFC